VILYRVSHVTTYLYTEPVSLCHNVARLIARYTPWQTVNTSELEISPLPAVRSQRIDYFGNQTTDFTIQEPHRELKLSASHLISVQGRTPQPDSTAWEVIRDQLESNRSADWIAATHFRFESRCVPTDPEYASYAATSFTAGRSVLDAVLDLTRRIHRDFVYDPKATTVTTSVREVFQARRGVCQDFAHVQLACLRSLGLAGRYISGYLMTTSPPGVPRLVGADASHAWISVFCGAAGWIEFDPTNDSKVGDRHILLAWGRDYTDVSPVKGVILGGGQHRVEVSVDARPEA
jgi:transglutaminase-like putative cysteine protease